MRGQRDALDRNPGRRQKCGRLQESRPRPQTAAEALTTCGGFGGGRASFVAALLLLAGATAAAAHATLIGVDPPDGSILPDAPTSVTLRFNEPVTPVRVQVIDASGHVRADTRLTAQDATLRLDLPADLPRGTQVVSYRVISADGHPVGGSVLFSIGAPTGSPGAANTGDAWRDGAIWLARVATYVGLFVGIGGVFALAWFVNSRPAARMVAGALGIGLVGAVTAIGLQGLDVLDRPLSAFGDAAAWSGGWRTSLGPSLAVAIASLLVAGASLRLRDRPAARRSAALALLGSGVTLALSGHAATAPPVWLMRGAITLHGIGVAVWVGALLPLLVLARRGDPALRPTLIRFSQAAVPVVALLSVAGLVLAAVQMQSVAAFATTAYGRLLLAKLILVVAMLGLAALNRLRLTAIANRDPRPIRRTIAAEIVIALAILGVVAGWRFTPPPRALADAAQAEPAFAHLMDEKLMVDLTITPGRAGPNSFAFALTDPALQALPAVGATVTLSLPSAGIEPIVREAARNADGLWHVDNVLLPQPGAWRLRVDVLVTDFQQTTLEDGVVIAP